MTSRRAFPHRSPRPNPALSLAVVALGAIGGLTACGGSDDEADATPAPQVEDSSTNAGADAPPTDTPGPGEVDAPTSGSGSGTMTLSDGTTFTFAMTTCETSENGADGLPLPDSYDLFGATADEAFTMQLIRAGLEEEFTAETASLEGDFDEDGKNAGIIYSKVVDTLDLSVDGGNVSGTVTLSPIGPNRPYGDEVEATVDVSC